MFGAIRSGKPVKGRRCPATVWSLVACGTTPSQVTGRIEEPTNFAGEGGSRRCVRSRASWKSDRPHPGFFPAVTPAYQGGRKLKHSSQSSIIATFASLIAHLAVVLVILALPSAARQPSYYVLAYLVDNSGSADIGARGFGDVPSPKPALSRAGGTPALLRKRARPPEGGPASRRRSPAKAPDLSPAPPLKIPAPFGRTQGRLRPALRQRREA